MITVMSQPTIVTTFNKGTFISKAINIVEPDGSRSVKFTCVLFFHKHAKRECLPSILKAKHSTNYSGVIDTPIVIADRAPDSIVIDLYPAIHIISISQSHNWCYLIKIKQSSSVISFHFFFVLIFFFILFV